MILELSVRRIGHWLSLENFQAVFGGSHFTFAALVTPARRVGSSATKATGGILMLADALPHQILGLAFESVVAGTLGNDERPDDLRD